MRWIEVTRKNRQRVKVQYEELNGWLARNARNDTVECWYSDGRFSSRYCEFVDGVTTVREFRDGMPLEAITIRKNGYAN